MLNLDKTAIIPILNKAGQAKEPFFLLSDFSGNHFEYWTTKDLAENKILIKFPNYQNTSEKHIDPQFANLDLEQPLSFKEYLKAFNKVKDYIQRGDTYLCNLTFSQKIKLHASLEELFYLANAKFKIYYPKHFLCFSPEIFVEIKEQEISTYPMKGTFPNLTDPDYQSVKEIAEHATVVDLLRNDLSLIASKVAVAEYRYFEEIKKINGENQWQSSSKITGKLPADWPSKLGEILSSLLPAGSVTGAPKEKTIQIINEIENYPRNFYTGVATYFNGLEVSSCVLIRFIEDTSTGFVFKTGGGITSESSAEKEYQELISKIYVPISGKH